MKEFIQLDFIRHDNPDRTKEVLRDELPLSESSIDILQKKAEEHMTPEGQSLGFTMGNKRSRETTNILVTGEKEDNRFRVKSDTELEYKVDWNFFEFKRIIGIPKDKHNIFKEIVEHSDQVKEEYNLDFTAYMDMVNKVKTILFKYKSVSQSWSKISKKYDDPGLYRFFCANEYFYPSFRSWVTEQLLGDEEFKKYIKWYSENFERNEDRKHEQCSVTLELDPSIGKIIFTLKDPFGTLTFNEEIL